MSDRLPLVLPGSGEGFAELSELWAGWVRQGIMRPVVVVEAARADGEEPQAAWVGWYDYEPLHALLAREVRASALELAVVHLAPHDGDAARARGQSAEDVAARLRARLGGAQTLTRVDVLVPEAAPAAGTHVVGGAVHQVALDSGADRVLVVSPEDRREPYFATAQDVMGQQLLGHAAHAVATAMGWWWLMPESPVIARGPLGGQADHAGVLVGRAAARLRRAPGLVERVAQDALHGPSNPDPDDVHSGAARPDAVVASASAQLVAHHQEALGFQPRAASPAPQPQRVTIREALAALAGFLLGRARDWPREFVAKRREAMERQVRARVQEMTYGERSAFTVQRGPAEDEAPGPALDSPDPANVTIPNAQYHAPQVWYDLRQAAFGLLDGGSFPEAVKPPTDGWDHPVVLPHPGYVSVSPQAEELVRTDPPLRPGDVRRTRQLQQAAASAGEGDGAASGPPPSDGADVAADNQPDEGEALGSVADRQPSEAVELTADAEELARCEAAQRATLCGQVAAQVADALDRAEAAFDADHRWLHYELHPHEEELSVAEEKADARFGRWLRRAVLAWVVLVAGTVAAILTAGVALLASAGVTAALVATGVVGALVAAFRRERARFQARNQLDTLRTQYLDAVSAVWHDALAVARLRSCYAQLLDWTDIIAGFVHEPAGAISQPELEDLSGTESAPLALQLTDATASDLQRQGLAQRARRRVCASGWLSRAFAVGAESCADQLRQRRGLDAQDAGPDFDNEVLGPEPARAALRDDVSAGRHGLAWQREVLDSVSDLLQKLPADQVVDRSLVRGGAESELPAFQDLWQGAKPPAQFAGQLFTPHGRQVEGAASVAEVWTYGDDQGDEQEGESADVAEHYPRPLAELPRSHPPQFGCFRLDLSVPSSPDSLALVAEPPQSDASVASGSVAAGEADGNDLFL